MTAVSSTFHGRHTHCSTDAVSVADGRRTIIRSAQIRKQYELFYPAFSR
ncbi:MAG: hypothetical protein HXL35_08140 [Prevotellaceae bacterium]|nr:hypothetical protein [Prevotellaceae bacterium]MBF1080532.1 hypothetical protein [Prevotellaceae bacterium]